MTELPEYILNLQGLRRGLNKLSFALDTAFFESFDYSLIQDGNVSVDLLVESDNEYDLIVDAVVNGKIKCSCDRCSRELYVPISNEGRIIIRITEQDLEDTEEIIHISPVDKSIDLGSFVYELISVSKPLKVVCDMLEGEECDENAKALIEKYSSKVKKSPEDNPMWEQLKRIKFDNR